MIEVEKNFDLKPGDKERLIVDATFVRRKTFTDIYYDTADFSLTRNDFWLRTRDGKFELKVPLNKENAKERKTDQYRELESDKEIISALNFSGRAGLAEELLQKGYVPFAAITTTRETYHKGDFHLDFDEMDFGFGTFEAELMVGNESEVSNAEKRILEFAEIHGISGEHARGKVIEYIFRRNPKHYETLLASRVV